MTHEIVRRDSLKEIIDLPEEIGATVEFALSGEAPLCQDVATIGTADALGVPSPVEHGEEELVEDRPITAGARHDHLALSLYSPVSLAIRCRLECTVQE